MTETSLEGFQKTMSDIPNLPSATGTPHAGMCVCDPICRAITEATR